MKIFFGNIPAASGPQNINVLQATETELAQAITVQKRVNVGQVVTGGVNLVPEASSSFATDGSSWWDTARVSLTWNSGTQDLTLTVTDDTGNGNQTIRQFAFLNINTHYLLTFRAKAPVSTYTPNFSFGNDYYSCGSPLTTSYKNYSLEFTTDGTYTDFIIRVGSYSAIGTQVTIDDIVLTEGVGGEIAQAITPQLVAGADRIDVTQVTETNTAQTLGKSKSKSIPQITETDLAQSVTAKRLVAVVQATETDSAQAVSVSRVYRVSIGQVTESDTSNAIGKSKHVALNQATETDTVNSVASIKRKAVALVSETDEAFTISSELRIETAFETDIAQSVTAQKLIPVIEATETDETFAINPTKQIAITQTTETNTADALSVQKRKSICPSSSYEIYCDAVSGAVKYHFFLEKKSDKPYHLIEGMDYLDQSSNTALSYKIGESVSPTFSIALPDDGSEYTSGIVVETGVGIYSGMRVQLFNTESVPAIETDITQSISIVKRKSITQITETEFANDIFPTVPGLIPVFRVIETDTAFTITALKLIHISAAEETEFAQGLAQILKRSNISLAEETDFAIGISDKAAKYIDITQVAEIDKAFVIRLFNPVNVNDETLQVNASVPLSVNVIDSYEIAALCTEFNITTNIYEDTIEVNYETPYLQEYN